MSTNDENPSSNLNLQDNLSKRALKRKQRHEKWLVTKAAKKTEKSEKKIAKRLEKDTRNFEQQCLQETSYYFQNGLRKVYPYHYTFATHAKGRWLNRRLLDIFADEFRHDSPENYVKSIENGKVFVNGEAINADYVVKSNDYIENVIHRHEVPVSGEEIDVIADDDDVVVVNKPSSIPIHPCGRYRHNSLTFILDKDYGYKNLRGLYRLDRLTSGVTIFAKNEKTSARLHEDIKNRRVRKEYLCRVEGKFPDGLQTVTEPLGVLSQKMGLFKVDPNGKECLTEMERLSYNGTSSVVKCIPKTGRTHQIRVHLQWLGHPIINDPLYNTDIWGPERGKQGNFGKTEEQLITDLMNYHNADTYAEKVLIEPNARPHDCEKLDNDGKDVSKLSQTPSKSEIIENKDIESKSFEESSLVVQNQTKTDETQTQEKRKMDTGTEGKGRELARRLGFEPTKLVIDEDCKFCHLVYQDPKPEQLVMYLHAYKYQGPGWEYCTAVPEWAQHDWTEAQTAQR